MGMQSKAKTPPLMRRCRVGRGSGTCTKHKLVSTWLRSICTCVFVLYMYTLYSMTVDESLYSVTVQVLTVLRYIAQDIRRSTTWRCRFLVVSNDSKNKQNHHHRL
jgi:hypothetical protein